MSTPTAGKPMPDILPRGDTWGIIFASVGILTVIISLIVQFSVIDNGTSNQLTIDAEVSKNIWGVFTGILLFVIGYALWINSGSPSVRSSISIWPHSSSHSPLT
jgi:hypothetical protein